jgi:import inner membrane translocase subunit TIM9
MDFSGVPEQLRQQMVRVIEQKQGQQFVDLFTFVLDHCYGDCITRFTSDTLAPAERTCLQNCTQKLLNVTNRLGQLMAEKQQLQAAQATNPNK